MLWGTSDTGLRDTGMTDKGSQRLHVTRGLHTLSS